ncbi:MAG TPA: hypothetical protein VE954_01825 [Oligoflexus sp.]|uniref:hypothetical protein n=1 Tax=Oligoflexus sp. TaxID=1971216 RepID=UPI002D6D07C1|nr:hypothetical protein [Oligoflexus sp.]HYX31823.1 hypothetical protein [Oligoflexus sp.]
MKVQTFFIISILTVWAVGCGVTHNDKDTEKNLAEGVKRRVDAEEVSISPKMDTYQAGDIIKLALAAPNNHTGIKVQPDDAYSVVSCPEEAAPTDDAVCLKLQSSADIEFQVIGYYTEYGPWLNPKKKHKQAASDTRNLTVSVN